MGNFSVRMFLSFFPLLIKLSNVSFSFIFLILIFFLFSYLRGLLFDLFLVFSWFQLYKSLSYLLSDYPELIHDLAGFLSPEHALQCGCYNTTMDFLKARNFLRKIEVMNFQQFIALIFFFCVCVCSYSTNLFFKNRIRYSDLNLKKVHLRKEKNETFQMD